MTQQTFFLIGGHCPRSKEDLQTIFNYFFKNGLKPVKKIKNADIICIYTCGGFDYTEKSSIKTILRILQKKSKDATVIVTGCLTKINPKSIKNFNGILLIEFDRLDELNKIIHSKITFSQTPHSGVIRRFPQLYTETKVKKIFDLLTNSNFIRNLPDYLDNLKTIYSRKINGENTRGIYHVRISRGCLGSCSYCSIKLAHGYLQSRPVEQIQKDFEIGLKKGYKTFKLIGTDIGSYGIDIKTNIVEILKIFFTLPGENKIIITDFNPQWLVKYYDQLEPLFIANHKKILSFRIPIESGSNNILTRMRRQYKIEEVKKYVSLLKEKIPSLKIYTHILVGFPGETDEDFQQTLDLLKEINFFSVSIFPYSERPMTEAFKMKEKISSEVIQERIKKIKALKIRTD